MSHNLTQPEEIDLVWMATAGDDMEVDIPAPDWAQSSGAIRNAERHEPAKARIDHRVS